MFVRAHKSQRHYMNKNLVVSFIRFYISRMELASDNFLIFRKLFIGKMSVS